MHSNQVWFSVSAFFFYKALYKQLFSLVSPVKFNICNLSCTLVSKVLWLCTKWRRNLKHGLFLGYVNILPIKRLLLKKLYISIQFSCKPHRAFLHRYWIDEFSFSLWLFYHPLRYHHKLTPSRWDTYICIEIQYPWIWEHLFLLIKLCLI